MKLARKKFGAIICCCWSVMSSEIKVKQTNALEKLRWAKQSDIQTVVLVEIVIHVTFWDVLMKCAQRIVFLKTPLQNTPASNGGPGFAVRVNPSKRQTQQNTIPQDHPKPSDWKHIQECFEEKIQNYEERIRKLSEENNNLRSETAVQRKQLEEKEKRIEELTTR